MKTMTMTAARSRFGALLKAVQREPILICRRNGDKAVVMSAAQFERMTGVNRFESEILSRKTARSSKAR